MTFNQTFVLLSPPVAGYQVRITGADVSKKQICTAVLFEILLLFCVDIILIAVDYPLRWRVITDNIPVETTGDAGFLGCSKTVERALSKTEGVLFLLKPIHSFFPPYTCDCRQTEQTHHLFCYVCWFCPCYVCSPV